MKLKSLLFMVTLLLVCLGVRADEKLVFEQHFESMIEDPTAVGYFEFINSEEGDERTLEDGALKFINDAGTLDKTSKWRRAVKFRNLPLKEGIYRLSFKLKGDKTYKDESDKDVNCKFSSLLLQGEDDADIDLKDFAGNEQRLEGEDLNPNEYVSYSRKIIFASEQQQKEAYTKGELADKFFMSLSVYNPGTFYIKDVVLTETDAVASAKHGDSAIKIEFVGNTNIAAMAKADPKGLVFFDDLSYASVTIDGEPAEVEAIEYHSDGCLYIFTSENSVLESTSVVGVTFINPTDEKQIKFDGKIESEASVFNFENVAPTYDESLEGYYSFLYEAPIMMSSNPINRSFAIDPQLGEFTFTFDRKVETAGIKAVLTRELSRVDEGANDEESDLILKEGQADYAETVVFVRNDNGVLARYNHIALTNVVSEKGSSQDDPYVISFETGIPKLAQEIITPIDTVYFDRPEDGNTGGMIPRGWTLVYDITDANPGGSEVRPQPTPETTYGSGPRIMNYQNGDYKNVFYVRSTSGYTTATYGNLEGYTISIPAGELHIDFMASGYKAAGQKIRCEVLDATGENVLATADYTTSENTPDWNWGGCTDPTVQETFTVYYNNPAEQNVILRYTVFANGQQETILSGVVINTYEKTEGDVPDDKTVFADATFGDAADNRAPTAASGWELWQAGSMRTPGGDFNYNGTRIFTGLAVKGLSVGYYCNGQWPNGFVQYGAANNDGAPTLALPAGDLEFTLYAANWKVNTSRDIYVQVLNEKEEVKIEQVFHTSPIHMDGQRSTKIEADKFTFSWTCPADGNYIVRFGSPAGETFSGNLSIIKPGSRAVKYYALIAAAVVTAKEALVEAEDPIYDGTTKNALAAAIAKYEDPTKITMTTEEEFKAAIAELNGLEKSMRIRIEYIPRFNKAYAAAEDMYTSAITTKYEKLDCFEILEDAVETYDGVNPSDLEDEVLVGSTTTMENASTLFKNLRDTGVALMTKQINGLADKLVELDETRVDDEYVTAAGESITDDQAIAEQLKLRLTKAIYDQCAAGDPFSHEVVVDEESGATTTVADSIAVTNYIQNGSFYVKVTTNSRDMQPGDAIPGWTIDKVKGNVGYEFSWVTWNGSELNPVLDAPQLIAGWNSELDFSQMLTELPVGKYRLVVGTQDRGFEDNSEGKKAALDTREHWHVTGTDGSKEIEGEVFSYIYTQTGDAEAVKTGFDISKQGQWYGKTDCNSVEFDVTDDGEATGSAKVGARMIEFASTASIDNFRLYMIGKAKDYDYAAAAAKLAARIDGSSLKGDVNGDGVVDIQDYIYVADYILGKNPEGFIEEAGDVDDNGIIDISDYVGVANIILTGTVEGSEQ